MRPAAFALVDCNNFFVSCERLFRPDLEERPVVVLSSNDGCVVARSNQAKALGIPMGAPAFKFRDLFKAQGVVQFSANFELYGDISERIIRVLTSITPRTEVYSVDESFLDLSELHIKDYEAWGRQLAQRIKQQVGMPVSVGLATSKTLAKLAADRAKKYPQMAGALDLITSHQQQLKYLAETDISNIWGVGWRLAPKLRAEGVHTALDLRNMRPRLAQQLMGIHGRQMVSELNGISCHPVATPKPRQSIMRGRMFGQDTNQFSVVEAAIASLAARACFYLRKDKLLAKYATIILNTNRNKPDYRRIERTVELDTPSADSGVITTQLLNLLSEVFSQRDMYHRANVLLTGLTRQDDLQPDLFGRVDMHTTLNSRARLQAVDALNDRYGKDTLRYAAEDLSDAWQPKHQLRSPRYTTNWAELPIIGTIGV